VSWRHGRSARAAAALALAAAALGCGGDGEGPVIDDILPAAAAAGATVEIIGDRFCGDPDDSADGDGMCVDNVAAVVNFGAGEQVARAQISSYRHNSISVAVPSTVTPGATVVVVIRDGVPSNSFDFEIQ